MIMKPEQQSGDVKATLFDATLDKVIGDLNVELAQGLSSSEVAKRLAQSGYNEVAETKANPILRFAGKFWGISAWMLEMVVILSWYLQKYPDMAIVAGLLIVNAVLSYVEEGQAERAVDALKSKLSINAKVLRDGQWTTTPARQVVPGDIIRLRAGDFVPADIKLADGELRPGERTLNTFSFLSLFFFAIFSLFVVRQDGHFWQSRPSATLGGVIAADTIIASMIGVFGLSDLPGIGWPILLFIVAYSLLFSLGVNDFFKVKFQNKEK